MEVGGAVAGGWVVEPAVLSIFPDPQAATTNEIATRAAQAELLRIRIPELILTTAQPRCGHFGDSFPSIRGSGQIYSPVRCGAVENWNIVEPWASEVRALYHSTLKLHYGPLKLRW